MDAGQQLSWKARVPPSGMRAGIKDVSIHHVRKELETWTSARALLTFRRSVTTWVFTSSPLVSCCGWKASQEGGGAGKPSLPLWPGLERGEVPKRVRDAAEKGQVLGRKGHEMHPEAEQPGWLPGILPINSHLGWPQTFSALGLLAFFVWAGGRGIPCTVGCSALASTH